MRAIVLSNKGSLGGLTYVKDRQIPNPREGAIRVKVNCVGLNPVDYKLADGWGDVQWDNPPVLGLDVSGTVDAIGPGVSGFSVGDRVYYHGNLSLEDGGFAEYACTSSHTVTPMPDELSMEQAAAIPCSGFTAYQAVVNKLKIRTPQPNATILIHGGAGGVGGYAIQLAKAQDVQVFSTCSENHKDYVKGLGVDQIIDYRKENIYERVMNETAGRGVDYIINTIDAETATKDIDMLAFGGELVAIVEHPYFARLKFYEKALSIHEVALGGAHLNGDWRSQVQLSEIGRNFASLMVKGVIKPLDLTIITLEEIPFYLEKLKGRHIAGKVVARI